jgi:hypothetical protein
MEQSLVRLAAWSAFAHAALSVFGLAALLLFFALGGFWGPLNDLLSVFWALTLIPVALLFYQLLRPLHTPPVLVVTIVGIAAMVAFAVLQFLLVVRLVAFEQTLNTIMVLFGVIGLTLIASALLARQAGTLPGRLFWSMLAYGAGYAVSSLGFWVGGSSSPLAAAGYLAAGIAGLVWGLSLGQWLANGYPVEVTTMIGGSR